MEILLVAAAVGFLFGGFHGAAVSVVALFVIGMLMALFSD